MKLVMEIVLGHILQITKKFEKILGPRGSKRAQNLSKKRICHFWRVIIGFDPSGYNPRIYFTPLIKHGYRGRRLIINSRNIKILSACIYAPSTVTWAQGPGPSVKALSFYLSATIEQTLDLAAKIGRNDKRASAVSKAGRTKRDRARP